MDRILTLILVLALGACAGPFDENAGNQAGAAQQPQVEAPLAAFDGKNASFTLGGKSITLVNGISETPIEDASAMMTTRYFGREATGDLNGDGLQDHAFMITRTTGGSGTFYYVVVALRTSEGYETTNAFLVGDRIDPQSMEIHARELHVNYADREVDEPMTAQPSEQKVLLLKVSSNRVLEGLME